MKNLSNRTKILLGITVAVIVLVVAIVVLAPASGLPLFGAAALAITPGDQTIAQNATLALNVNAVYNCNWFTSDANLVSIETDATEVKTVTVKGQNPGTATIEARCGLINVNHVTTTVKVAPPPTISPSAPVLTGHGQTVTLSTGDDTCTWSATSPDPALSSVSLDPRIGASTVVTALNGGTATVAANCAGGRVDTNVTVWPVITTTGSYTIKAGETVPLTVGETGNGCSWMGDMTATLSADTGSSTTYIAPATVDHRLESHVTVVCRNGAASVTVIVTP